MIEGNTTAPSLRRQCELIRVSRSGLSYTPVSTDIEALALIRRIDEVNITVSLYGSRMLGFTLWQEGFAANCKRVQRDMRIESMAPEPSTSAPYPEHAKYSYLFRGLHIYLANQVWATDITYIPM